MNYINFNGIWINKFKIWLYNLYCSLFTYNFRINTDRQNYKQAAVDKQHLFASTIGDILKKLGRPIRQGQPYIVKCEKPPINASTNCQVSEQPCLFNITQDPCEYHNLAANMPNMVKELLNILKSYNETAVKPGNKPADPAAYPMYHGGIWVPWIKLNHT